MKGQFQGDGIFISPDGDRYEGSFVEGQFSGLGTYKSFDGYGIYSAPAGKKFEGLFKNGKIVR